MLLLLVSLPLLLWAEECKSLICDSYDTYYNGSILNGRVYGPSNVSASVSNNGQINASIDTSFYYSAPSSLHVTCPSGSSPSGVVLTKNAPAGSGWPQVYGRAMVYYSNASGAKLPTSVHSWLFSANGNNNYFANNSDPTTNKTTAGVSMNIIVGNPRVQLNYHWSTSESSTGSMSIQANKWLCLQWHYDGPNSGAKVWVDGAIFINVTHNNSVKDYTPKTASNWRFANSPGWSRVQFGYNHYQNLTAPVDVHLDDLIIDTQMTCCPCEAGVMLPHCCAAFVPPTSAPPTSAAPNADAPTEVGATRAPTADTGNPSSSSVLAASVFLLSSLMMITVF